MFQLRNYMEEAVKDYVERWLPKEDVCQCELCRIDIMATMLNRLPPAYGITQKGELFAQINDFILHHEADLMARMTEAVNIVKRNPRH